MNNIENIGLKYRLDVNNQIPNNVTRKEEFEKHENEYFGCYFVEAFLYAFQIVVLLATNIVLLRAKF